MIRLELDDETFLSISLSTTINTTDGLVRNTIDYLNLTCIPAAPEAVVVCWLS